MSGMSLTAQHLSGTFKTRRRKLKGPKGEQKDIEKEVGKLEFLVTLSHLCVILRRENDGLVSCKSLAVFPFIEKGSSSFSSHKLKLGGFVSCRSQSLSHTYVWFSAPSAPGSGLVHCTCAGTLNFLGSAGPPYGDWLTGGCREADCRITVGFTSLPYVPSGASEDRRGQ